MIQSEENDYVGMSHHIQGDPSGSSKLPVDFETKVPLWPGQARPGQAKAKLLL